MNEFKASNGVVVRKLGRTPFVGVISLQLDEFDALREFFRAEEDERLGRLRWPEFPGYVVYPKANGSVRVVEEITGQSEVFDRVSAKSKALYADVAEAYFAAHPEPKKPWEDAKAGEVWVLTYVSMGELSISRPFTVDAFNCFRNTAGMRMGDLNITAGRRIFPEGDTE